MRLFDTAKPCSCGSGLTRHAVHDARGIFCTYACTKCEKAKTAGYRPEIFTDPGYWTDEDVEPDE